MSPAPTLPPTARLAKADYVHFFSRVFRCFNHPMNAEIDQRRYHAMPGKRLRPLRRFTAAPFELNAAMVAMLEQDWEKDTAGSEFMYFGAFHDAVFEVADIWSSYDTPESYVSTLTMLWICLTKDGERVAPLNEVKPFNLVAYEKCDGDIRGPATFTETMAPVSLEGNSNWFGVSLPTSFIPPPAVSAMPVACARVWLDALLCPVS